MFLGGQTRGGRVRVRCRQVGAGPGQWRQPAAKHVRFTLLILYHTHTTVYMYSLTLIISCYHIPMGQRGRYCIFSKRGF